MKINSKNNSITDELVKLTCDLISFKTTDDNPIEIDRCLEYIKDYFEYIPVIIKTIEHNNKKSLIISYEDKNNFKVLLNGHIDVVAAEPEQFAPHIKNDKIYGRGASDMKGGVAVLMLLIKELSQLDIKPDIALMIVSDEEIGGYDCSGYLANQYSADLVIAAEPNRSKDPAGLDITIGHKGVLWLKVSTTGKSCHASRPWDGENAIEKLLNKYVEIKKIIPEVKTESWLPTLNLGKIVAGNSINKVPDYAEMYLDIRFTEEPTSEVIINKIKEIKKINIEVLENSAMLFNNVTDNKAIEAVKTTAESILNRDVKFLKEHGASDMRFFSEKNIPSIVFGPYGENLHGLDENISILSMQNYCEIMYKYLANLY